MVIIEAAIMSERSDHMKIYLFDPESGIYLGEDFAEPPFFKGDPPVVPPDATTIAPPPYSRGEVPVFNVRQKRWEIRPIFALVPGDFEP
jgi:hypothetical protein